MILLVAVVAGLIAGLLRAAAGRRNFRLPTFQHTWLVFAALLPQLIVFGSVGTRWDLPDRWAAVVLVASQIALLFFAWSNRTQPGVTLMGIGLLLNFAVIALNGGLMPISPETVRQLVADLPRLWHVGERFGSGKDIILPVEDTNLWWLSDRFFFTTTALIYMRVAFSAGDVLIAIGAFWLMWSIGSPYLPVNKEMSNGTKKSKLIPGFITHQPVGK
jgi:hypothetical protein